jgi:hypothetical protein
MKFEKAFEAFAAFLETLSVAMTAANSINPVVNFFGVRSLLFLFTLEFTNACLLNTLARHQQSSALEEPV